MPCRKSFASDEDLRKRLGADLAGLRKEAKLSQQQLAERIGISQRTVSDIEKGNSELTLTKLVRFVQELGAEMRVVWPPKNGEIYLIRHHLR